MIQNVMISEVMTENGDGNSHYINATIFMENPPTVQIYIAPIAQ